MNNLIETLDTLINFGIKKDEKLTDEERLIRIKEFRDNLDVNNYRILFHEIDGYLKNNANNDKEEVALKAIEFISYFSMLENNVNKLPVSFQNLYQSNTSLYYINIYFEHIKDYGVFVPIEFDNFLKQYIDFLKNVDNKEYINICKNKILKLNLDILSYLNKKENNQKYYEFVINQDDLNTFCDLTNTHQKNKSR